MVVNSGMVIIRFKMNGRAQRELTEMHIYSPFLFVVVVLEYSFIPTPFFFTNVSVFVMFHFFLKIGFAINLTGVDFFLFFTDFEPSKLGACKDMRGAIRGAVFGGFLRFKLYK